MEGSILLVCFWAYLNCIIKTGAIDVDYYFNSLRSKDCYSKEGDKACRAFCGELDMLCHRGQCSCHKPETSSNPKFEIIIMDEKGQLRYDSGNNVKGPIEAPKDQRQDIENPVLNELNLRPALRHHIAHFCPNLDVARQCIRTCMGSGKPAFCGKDHFCYCGHKYTSHDKKSVANADAVYRNFQDLYEKYFGKKPADEDTIVESQN